MCWPCALCVREVGLRVESGVSVLAGDARTNMKIITHKQSELAMDHTAELLKKDGWIQAKTVQQWLDEAEYHPAQFQSSLPALEVLGLLGFENELIQARDME